MQVKGKATGEDTSFNGMVGAIARGEVTTSVAGKCIHNLHCTLFPCLFERNSSHLGVAISKVRSEVLDFPVAIARCDSAIFIRRPSGSAATQDAYTSEFEVGGCTICQSEMLERS